MTALARRVGAILEEFDDFDWEQRSAEDASDGAPVVRFMQIDPADVAVEVRDKDGEILVLRWEKRWKGPGELEPDPELVGRIGAMPDDHEFDAGSLRQIIDYLVRSTALLRRERYIECQFCGESTPPEFQFDGETCQTCASDEFGVVY